MPPISTVIVDDERLARNRIRRLLGTDPDLEVIAECSNGHEAVSLLASQPPHLLFLDVQMPGMDGFEVLKSIEPDRLPVVVFVTAYDEYAVRAFEAHAFDYLLKPFDRTRFEKVLERAKRQVRLLQHGEMNAGLAELLSQVKQTRPPSTRIAIRSGGHVLMLPLESIDWVEAADNYVCLHCGANTHMVRETMNSFEQRLDPARFLRIHRSAIVNRDRVREIRPWLRGDYQVVLDNGVQLTLSRSYRDRVRSSLLARG